MGYTQINIKDETKERLDVMREKRETIDGFVNRLMDLLMERQAEVAVSKAPIDTRTEMEKAYDEQVDP